MAVAFSDDVHDVLRTVADAAVQAGRTDLAARLTDRAAGLNAPELCVVVAGEFKAGKSSLVNALVGANICPVDDDVATSVPTLLRFAATPGVRARRNGDDADGDADGDGSVEEVGRLAAYATEHGNPDNREGLRFVEVGIPSPALRDGLVLVDTPGVGGLRSAYASATMTALAMAHAVVFVSDASQEYTRPELDFLAAAARALPGGRAGPQQGGPDTRLAADFRARRAVAGPGRRGRSPGAHLGRARDGRPSPPASGPQRGVRDRRRPGPPAGGRRPVRANARDQSHGRGGGDDRAAGCAAASGARRPGRPGGDDRGVAAGPRPGAAADLRRRVGHDARGRHDRP